MIDYGWRDKALCARIMFLSEEELAACGDDSDLIYARNVAKAHSIFFPARGENQIGEEAKSICQQCPVAQECLANALKTRVRDGVWGGASGRLRRRIHEMRISAQVGASVLPDLDENQGVEIVSLEEIIEDEWGNVWASTDYETGLGLDGY